MALSTEMLDNLMDFIYLDEAPKVFLDTELAKSMLVVADQMLIGRLKEACECALAAAVTLKNAAELMQFAATYNAPQLKVCCMQFISFNLPAFIESKFVKTHFFYFLHQT
jgi:inhibitor of Bruton tyrosine kinase